MTRRLGLVGSLGAVVALSVPGLAGEPASEEELRAALSGTTLSGYNTSGVVFSEYHAPDGRILGHNNGEPVLEGCWEIKAGGVCYYYARSRRAGTYCWRYRQAGPRGYELESFDGAVTGMARRDPGNPRRHSDQGESWSCERPVSDRGGGRRSAAGFLPLRR